MHNQSKTLTIECIEKMLTVHGETIHFQLLFDLIIVWQRKPNDVLTIIEDIFLLIYVMIDSPILQMLFDGRNGSTALIRWIMSHRNIEYVIPVTPKFDVFVDPNSLDYLFICIYVY